MQHPFKWRCLTVSAFSLCQAKQSRHGTFRQGDQCPPVSCFSSFSSSGKREKCEFQGRAHQTKSKNCESVPGRPRLLLARRSPTRVFARVGRTTPDCQRYFAAADPIPNLPGPRAIHPYFQPVAHPPIPTLLSCTPRQAKPQYSS